MSLSGMPCLRALGAMSGAPTFTSQLVQPEYRKLPCVCARPRRTHSRPISSHRCFDNDTHIHEATGQRRTTTAGRCGRLRRRISQPDPTSLNQPTSASGRFVDSTKAVPGHTTTMSAPDPTRGVLAHSSQTCAPLPRQDPDRVTIVGWRGDRWC